MFVSHAPKHVEDSLKKAVTQRGNERRRSCCGARTRSRPRRVKARKGPGREAARFLSQLRLLPQLYGVHVGVFVLHGGGFLLLVN